MQGIRGMDDAHPVIKTAFDIAASVTVVAAMVGWMPMIALGIAIIYHAIQIWETDTVRGWTGRQPRPSPFHRKK